MRLKILKTALCVQPTSSKFLMLKSILYAIHVFLNIVEIFSLLQSNDTCLMFSLTLHRLQRPFSCLFIRRSLSFRFSLPNLKENISTILRNTCIAYKMDFNIKNLLDVGCTQSAVFRLLSLITNGKIV